MNAISGLIVRGSLGKVTQTLAVLTIVEKFLGIKFVESRSNKR